MLVLYRILKIENGLCIYTTRNRNVKKMTGAKRKLKFGGQSFSFDSEYRTKTEAKRRATTLRNRGMNARVSKTTYLGVVSGKQRIRLQRRKFKSI